VGAAFKAMEKRDLMVLMDVEDFDGSDPDTMSMLTMLSQLCKTLQSQPEGPGYQD